MSGQGDLDIRAWFDEDFVVASGPTTYNQALSGSLSFTGAKKEFVSHGLPAAILSFTGAAVKVTSHPLTAAALSFTGSQARRAGKVLAAALSFVGTIPARAIGAVRSGALSFTGSQTKKTSALRAGTLSFIGNVVKLTATARTATLSFTGAIQTLKAFGKTLTATLSFTGAFGPTSTKHTAAGALSFAGAQSRAVVHGMTAAVSFVGSAIKSTRRAAMTGSLAFAGAVQRTTSRAVAAAVGFTGNISRSTRALRTASLSFVGAKSVAVSHLLTAAFSFLGNLGTGQAGHFFQSLSAALSFTGTTTRLTRRPTLAGVLSFVGATAKRSTRFFTASVGMTGALQTLKAFGKALTAALSFTGSQVKQVNKKMVAVQSFTGAIARAIAHVMWSGLKLNSTRTVTNLIASADSENFSSTNWAVGSALNPIIPNSTDILDPDGGNNAAKWVLNDTTGNRSFGYVSVLIPPGVTIQGRTFAWSFNVYIPGTNSAGSLGAYFFTNGEIPLTVTINLNSLPRNQWCRVAFMFTPLLASSTRIQAQFHGNFGDTAGDMMYVYKPLLEEITGLPRVANSYVKGSAELLTANGNTMNGIQVIEAVGAASNGFTKLTSTTRAAVLSFVGLARRTFIKPVFAAALSFTGAMSRRTQKVHTASLSFVGTWKKQMRKALASALSFLADFQSGGNRAVSFVAQLSFSGSVRTAHTIAKALAAVLSFTGAQRKQVGKALAAQLTFTTAVRKFIKHGMASALSFLGKWLGQGGRYDHDLLIHITTLRGVIPVTSIKEVMAVTQEGETIVALTIQHPIRALQIKLQIACTETGVSE